MSAAVDVILAKRISDFRCAADDLALVQVEEPSCGYAASLVAELADGLQAVLDRRADERAGARPRLHVVPPPSLADPPGWSLADTEERSC